MNIVKALVKLQQGLRVNDLSESDKNVGLHDNHGRFHGECKVGDSIVCHGAWFLHYVERFVYEVSNKHCHVDDQDGLDALPDRVYFIMGVLGIFSNLTVDGHSERELPVLVEHDAVRYESACEWQLVAKDIVDLGAELYSLRVEFALT